MTQQLEQALGEMLQRKRGHEKNHSLVALRKPRKEDGQASLIHRMKKDTPPPNSGDLAQSTEYLTGMP